LEHTHQDLREQQVAAHIEFDKEKQSLTTQIQDLKGQYETTKVQLNKHNPILPVRMNNKLKEFEELLLKYLIQGAKPSLGRLKPQVEGVVANCSKVHKGAYLG
jgi:hypothetical protein